MLVKRSLTMLFFCPDARKSAPDGPRHKARRTNVLYGCHKRPCRKEGLRRVLRRDLGLTSFSSTSVQEHGNVALVYCRLRSEVAVWPADVPFERSAKRKGISAQEKHHSPGASTVNVALCRPGGHGGAAAPVPIPNTAVKRPSAYGTSS
jgi:hypothetical protein